MATNRTFKGAPKPMGASGHFDEPRRHALQAQGIKTGHLATPIPMPNTPAQKPIPTPEPITFEDTLKADFAKQFGHDKDEIKVEEKDDYWEVKIGNEEYMVFADSDKAEQYAIEQVKEDLENEPGSFNQDWLEGYIDIDGLRDQLESDVSDHNQDYYDDIESESDSEWQNRCVAELIHGGHLEEDDFKDGGGELKDITPGLQNKIDTAKEEAAEEMTKENLEDPMEYLEGYFEKEGVMKEAIRIAGINVDEAAQDAIDTDGVAHFLARYDGDEIELPSGAYAYRTN